MERAWITIVDKAWHSVADDYPAYRLLVPGDPSFVCQAEACNAHCCRAFSVSLGDREVERMTRASGLQPVEFLESEDGAPIVLPLLQPYLLARSDGHCGLLAADLSCGQYAGRPDACHLYPHQVLAVEAGSLAVAMMPRAETFAALEGALTCVPPPPAVVVIPLLLRHAECPGFTGPALTPDTWTDLALATARLQYGGR